jgi:hypothetical protein
MWVLASKAAPRYLVLVQMDGPKIGVMGFSSEFHQRKQPNTRISSAMTRMVQGPEETRGGRHRDGQRYRRPFFREETCSAPPGGEPKPPPVVPTTGLLQAQTPNVTSHDYT